MTKELVYTSFIQTTPEKLWAAITNPEFSRQYWGGHANVSDWTVGASWQHEDTNDGNAVRIAGKVLEYDPPKRLVISWYSPNDEADISKVTFIIDPYDGAVRLDVIHDDFKVDSKMAEHVSNGWPLVLSSMKTYLETGKGIDVMRVFKGGCGNKEAAA
jgi:uncharacterized protein YndB with AHSA1/START domain